MKAEAKKIEDPRPNLAPCERAFRIALTAHAGQEDKAGAPYLLHAVRVASRLEDGTERIAALLHDVVEDTPLTLDDLRAAGIPEEAVRLVDLLTKRPGESRSAYCRRLEGDPAARRIKLADLEDNLDVRRLRRVTARDARRLNGYLRVWRRLKALEARAAGMKGG